MIERIGPLYDLGNLRIVKRLDAGNFTDSFLVSDDNNRKYADAVAHNENLFA